MFKPEKSELKLRWVKTLKTGVDPVTGRSYRQAQGVLKKLDAEGAETFCCLGVLCDLVDPNGWRDVSDLVDPNGWRDVIFAYGDEEDSERLPNGLVNELFDEGSRARVESRFHDESDVGSVFVDLDVVRATLDEEDFDKLRRLVADPVRREDCTLAALNDAGVSFEGIASVIEAS